MTAPHRTAPPVTAPPVTSPRVTAPRPAGRSATLRREVPARTGLPPWLCDHSPVALALTGGSVLLAVALFLDTPLHGIGQALAPEVHRVFARLTRVGNSAWAILLALALCIGFSLRARHVPRPRDALMRRHVAGLAGFVLAAILASGIAANLLKWGLARARPSLSDGAAPFDFAPIATSAGWASFPSGHATTIVALAVALGFFWPRFRLAFLSLALWIAASRVIVGAHWASDVVAGAALGAASALALRLWYARQGRVFVLRRGRLDPRTRRLKPLLGQEVAALRRWSVTVAARIQARLSGVPPRPADRAD